MLFLMLNKLEDIKMEKCCWLCITLNDDKNFDLYQLLQVDSGLDFEIIRNVDYCPNCGVRLKNNRARNLMDNQPCTLCHKYGIEKGDTLLYRDYNTHNGILFREINNIQFCPVCGDELKEDNT